MDVALSGGGSDARFKLNGVIDTSKRPSEILESMLSTMMGRLVHSAGKFEVHAGKYDAPTLTISEDDVVSDVTLQTRSPRKDQYNGVKGKFISSADLYLSTDYPAQVSSSYQTQDGEAIYLDLNLPMVTSHYHAQRLAKLVLLKSRMQRTLSFKTNLAGLKAKIGDNIRFTNTKLGLSNAVYEITEYTLNNDLTVSFTCKENDEDVYDWETSDEQPYTSPTDINIYSGEAEEPTGLTVVARTTLLADGSFRADLYASWTAPEDIFNNHYILEWTDGTDSASVKLSTTSYLITGLKDSTSYTVKVRSVNNIGNESDNVSATQTTSIDSTAPSKPSSNLSVTADVNRNILDWDYDYTTSGNEDFDRFEVYAHTANITPITTSGIEATTLIASIKADTYIHEIGSGNATRHYWVRAIDRTGNKSDFAYLGNGTTASISYSDVSGTPTIPTNTSDLTNDSNFATTGDIPTNVSELTNDSNFATTGDIPTNVSDLTNDSNFVTASDIPSNISDLTNDSGYITSSAITDFITSSDVPSNPQWWLKENHADTYALSNQEFNTAFGRNPVKGDVLAVQMTDGTSETYQYSGSAFVLAKKVIDGGLIVEGTLNASDIQTGTLNASNITVSNLRADDISGGVVEAFALQIPHNINEINSNFVVKTFDIKAPQHSITKRSYISGSTTLRVQDTSGSGVIMHRVFNYIEKKSRGQNGIDLGTAQAVASAVNSGSYYFTVTVSGDYTDTIDPYCGVASVSSGASYIGSVVGFEYDTVNDQTTITYSAVGQLFTTSTTVYLSKDKFAASGSWVSQALLTYIYALPSNGTDYSDSSFSFYTPLAVTDAKETYRMKITHGTANGVTAYLNSRYKCFFRGFTGEIGHKI